MQDFGIKIEDNFISIPSLLPSHPQIIHDRTNNSLRRGAWSLTGMRFNRIPSRPLLVLPVIALGGRGSEKGDTEDLRESLISHGVAHKDIKHVGVSTKLTNHTRAGISQNLTEALRDLKKQCPLDIPIILVVLHKKDISTYAEVKRWGDCNVGIPTICVTSSKLGNCPKDFNLRANLR